MFWRGKSAFSVHTRADDEMSPWGLCEFPRKRREVEASAVARAWLLIFQRLVRKARPADGVRNARVHVRLKPFARSATYYIVVHGVRYVVSGERSRTRARHEPALRAAVAVAAQLLRFRAKQ